MIIPESREAAFEIPRGARREDEVLYHSERSRVTRRFLGSGSVIDKQAFGADASARVRHEAAMLERLATVPGVVNISLATDGDAQPSDSIRLEDVAGVPLSSVMQAEKIGVDALLELALELTKIVAGIHHLGIAHRDINPANILLVGPQRRPMLIDFHIASSFAGERPAFTAQAEIAGTLAYIAPEQTGRTGRIMDQRVDLYALGATLYELATGRTPFGADDSFQVIRDHLVRVPTPPATLDADIPQPLSNIIMRLLQKEPDRRYQSAGGLASDLERLIERRAHGNNDAFPLGEHDFPERLLPPSRLIGREAEVAALEEAFEGTLTGRGNGFLITGAPGVGKTALINELRSTVTAAGGWFVVGKFEQHGEGVASNAVLGVYRDLVSLLLSEPENELRLLRAALRSKLGANAGLAAAVSPDLALLLDVEPDTSADIVNVRDRLARIGLDVMTCIASKARPLVFVLDNLQWAPATALAFIDAMMTDAKSPGLLLIGAYRGEEVGPAQPLAALLSRWQQSSRPPRELVLNDLPPSAVAELLQEMLRLSGDQAAGLADVVAARTRGNPCDTVELINALRRDGLLERGFDGWLWDAETIRRYVGSGDVVDFLTVRIGSLPPQSRTVLDVMACLAGEVDVRLLQAATGFSTAILEEHLTPPLDDGLLAIERGVATVVRFRHDRVREAAYGALASSDKSRLHLQIARRLADLPAYDRDAARQYFAATDLLAGLEEKRRAVTLFRNVAARATLVANYVEAERFLAAALALLGARTPENGALLASIEKDLHAALYSLGRLEQADAVYESIAGRASNAGEIVDSTCVQISSLTDRRMPRAALDLGLDLLARLGLAIPQPDRLDAVVEERLSEVYRWCNDEAARAGDLQRAETSDPYVRGLAKIIARLTPPAFFCDQSALAWLVLESLRLWSEHGPIAALVDPVSLVRNVTIVRREDYRIGYQAGRHVLTVSETRGYEPETSVARFLFAVGIEHWFESFEETLAQSRLALDGLLRGGDLQHAGFTYLTSIALLFECSATVDEFSAEVDAALAFSERIRNDVARDPFLASRQLARCLRGETIALGSFADASFDEEAYVAGIAGNPAVAAYFFLFRAYAAALFGQSSSFLQYAKAAKALLWLVPEQTAAASGHLLWALALAQSLRAATPEERTELLVEIETSRAWLQRRADDAPHNFLHAVRLIEAECAWALEDHAAAGSAFEAALREAQPVRSPRHEAFIAERAGLFHLEHGLERYGRLLLANARTLYAAWGVTAKVLALERAHPFLLDFRPAIAERSLATTMTINSERLDMVGIVRASQALSSETSLTTVRARVAELLAALTGATAVLLVIRLEESNDWAFLPDGEGAAPIVLVEAGARGLVPLSAFRYVERTREPLLCSDAARDDRFVRDPYFAGSEQCSLLVVPILRQGELRAMLLLENRLSRGAFSTGRLDAVMLIAGQLAVSLDNARLYASLEQKVAERTEALAAANRQLALLSLTDALTGLPNRRSFDEKLQQECARARRSGASIGLAMIDIDEFKKYNDHYGHAAGDECLRRVATTLRDGLRPGSDFAARYGGEEFVLILSDTDGAGTYATAERLRAAVAALREPHAAAASRIVTVSVGVAAFVPSAAADAEQFLRAADVALYEAKHDGRNRVARALEA